MKEKLGKAFLANHERLYDLFYVRRELTKEQHDQFHARNWLLLEKTLLDKKLVEDLPTDPEAPPEKQKKRSEEIEKLLAGIPITDEDWGTKGLKTVAEIMKEAEV